MEVVANLLSDTAISRVALDDKDLFGRSAFNRYYYASFLLVRESLVDMNDAWRRLKHKAFPEVLMGSVVEKLKEGKRSAVRTGDNELASMCSVAIDAARDLAAVMQEGYAVRIVADYEPSARVEFQGNKEFSLNSITVSHARRWAPRVRALSGKISHAWRQLSDE